MALITPTSGKGFPESDLRRATEIKIAKTFRIGIKPEEVVASYDDWSENFEEIINQGFYKGPVMALEEILARVPPESRGTARVLDVGAGTGWLGVNLYKEGFRHMHALDPSEGMLIKLRKKGVYTKEFPEPIGVGQCSVPSDTYDLVICSGCFDEGHIPVTGLDELVRVTNKGGLVIIVMLLKTLNPTEPYTGKLQPYMEELEKKGAWIQIQRRVLPGFSLEKDGVVLTFRVA